MKIKFISIFVVLLIFNMPLLVSAQQVVSEVEQARAEPREMPRNTFPRLLGMLWGSVAGVSDWRMHTWQHQRCLWVYCLGKRQRMLSRIPKSTKRTRNGDGCSPLLSVVLQAVF